MSCGWAEKISLLIDGELPPNEARALEHHLTACSECQHLRTDFLSLRSQLSSYPYNQPWSNVALAKVLGTAGHSRELPRSARRLAFGLNFNQGIAIFATVVIFALLAGIIAYHNLRDHEPRKVTQLTSPNNSTAAPSPEQKPSSQQLTATVDKTQTPHRSVVAKNKGPRAVPQVKTTRAPEASAIAEVQPLPAENSTAAPIRAADAETLTAMHFEKAELLLRSFRNVRLSDPGGPAEVSYEKIRAQRLVFQNMMLRREADSAGDVQVASLLENLEPILIDIANLPDKPVNDDIRAIKERVERKNIVALLQVNSTALARAMD